MVKQVLYNDQWGNESICCTCETIFAVFLATFDITRRIYRLYSGRFYGLLAEGLEKSVCLLLSVLNGGTRIGLMDLFKDFQVNDDTFVELKQTFLLDHKATTGLLMDILKIADES